MSVQYVVKRISADIHSCLLSGADRFIRSRRLELMLPGSMLDVASKDARHA